MLVKYDRPVGVVVNDIAIVAGGCGFNSRAVQIGHSVPNGSPPLLYYLGAMLRRWATLLVTIFFVIPCHEDLVLFFFIS